MGLDAPSSDHTERIRAARKAMIAAGELEPARPGEHALHGRGGVNVETLQAAHAARDRRSARSSVPEVVDYSALEEGYDDGPVLSVEDGGDTLEDPVAIAEMAAADGPPLPDEADEPVFDLSTEPKDEFPGSEELFNVDSAQADAVQAEILEQVKALHERADGQDTALILIAKALTDAANDNEALAEMLVTIVKLIPRERVPWYSRLWRWLRSAR